MADGSESPSSAKVRELISTYERHANSTKQLEDYNGRPRSKSIGNALSYKLFRQPNLEFHSIVDIEKELVKIEAHLNYYEVYEKETHVAFQEQLFNVLTSIVNIDPEDQEVATQLKKKLILDTQKLATDLNSKLPFDGNHSYKGMRRTYSTYVRKEEAVVSTTSVKSQEHRAILSSQTSHNATLNGTFKSEESLNSTRDSVDLSSRQDESSIDLTYLEERPQSSTPPPQKKIVDDAYSSLIPSVSKLKQFFSFRRETKPEVKVSSSSYSGLSRSQSLNAKGTKYNVSKRNKKDEARKKENAISENEEVIEKNQTISTSTLSQESGTSQTINTSQTVNTTNQLDSTQSSVHIEAEKEAGENVEERTAESHNVSVSKLKSLFETNQNETNEGLGLLTQKQNEFSSDFNIPFTAMNLGAYRLKRTISGNYMNFTGLIRNVEINKKGDLSKSKSLTDLKITNFSYGARDLDEEDDLSKELDDNDDDFEHVSINIGKESKEVNNNVVKAETIEETIDENKEPVLKVPIQLRVGSVNTEGQSQKEVSTSEISQTGQRENKSIFLSKSVETLKQTFENLSTSSGQRSKETNLETRHGLYKTVIEPVPSTTTVVVEPVLKVPIQLRTGFTEVNHSKEVIENSNSTTTSREYNDDITHIIHRTIEPITSTTNDIEEPRLKVPIQLRTGFVDIKDSQEASGNTYEIKTVVTEDKEISAQQEPVLKVPIQLRVGVENKKENVSSTSSDLNTEEIRPILHRIIEPISSSASEPVLKVPIQLRTGFLNVSHSHDVTENLETEERTLSNGTTVQHTSESPGTVETLAKTFENISSSNSELNNEDIEHIIHRTIEPISSSAEEPVLKVPIQLRIGFGNVGHTNEVTENLEPVEQNSGDYTSIQYSTEEPVLKVPIQLRTGFGNVSNSNEVAENLEAVEKKSGNESTVQYTTESLVSAGTVETLKHTFENSSISHSELNNKDVEHITYRTIEPILSSADRSEESVLIVPIQLRTDFGKINHSQEVTENLEAVEKTEGNDATIQYTTESLASSGTVGILKKSFENSSNSHSELNNENLEHLLRRTIQPISSSADQSEEQVLKVPIQLRTGFGNVTHSHEVTENLEAVHKSSGNDSTIQYATESFVSEGAVETLKQTFENNSHSELNNEDVEQVLHRIIQPISSNADRPDDPVLKVPIQLRTGFGNVSHYHEVTENLGVQETNSGNESIVQYASETLASPGTVETLKQTFENISSTSNSELNNEDIEHILHRTIEPISRSADGSEEVVLKVPIQLRTGFVNVNQSHEVTENLEAVEKNSIAGTTVLYTSETLTSPETVEILKETFENLGTSTSSDGAIGVTQERAVLKVPIDFRTGFTNEYHSENEVIEHLSEHQTEISHEEPLLKTPIQLRVGNNIGTLENQNNSRDISITTDIEKREKLPIVDVTLYSNGQENAVSSENGTMARARIEEKTESFMKILDSPTEFSSIVSNSSFGQSQHASSTSKVSVSYSGQRSVQHTASTRVSQRIVSSSSSSLSSQQSSRNYLQVFEKPASFSLLSSLNSVTPTAESTISFREVEGEVQEGRRLNVNLNVSQENIIDEILRETDSLENIDEQFEKMLEENTK